MRHLNKENREIIEESLNNNYNFTQISTTTGYHRTTIANEIIKHRVKGKEKTYGNNNLINCMYEETCDLYLGAKCTKKCSKYQKKECVITQKPPYVCNGCDKKRNCKYQKYYYWAKEAQQMYESDLINSRSGLNIPEEIINQINLVIAPLIKEKKQTVNQVYINHPDILCFSKSEFYRLVNLGYLDIKNIDLPRQVKYRKRKNSNSEIRRTRKESVIRLNRTYSDFITFKQGHPNVIITELDTVEGSKGGKVFLTITLTKFQLMLIYLLDKQDSINVSNKFEWIQETIGDELYFKCFACALTDNGKEFIDEEEVAIIERNNCHLFFCDPSSPYQKGCCEENHHYIRYYLPKGTCSFDDLTQEDCNLLMSNINCIPREKLNGKTPFDVAQEILPESMLNKLGIQKINSDEVSLSPSILNGKGRKQNVK